jgi:hypothetical protein
MRQTFLLLSLLVIITSCKKIEGPGGTSAIRGKLSGQDYSFGEKEITTVSFTTGATIEHGDYWLLNSTDNSKLYYIYYTNPSWISSADPQLQGRTGIAVSFNYSDSNLEVAQRTLDSIQQLKVRVLMKLNKSQLCLWKMTHNFHMEGFLAYFSPLPTSL